MDDDDGDADAEGLAKVVELVLAAGWVIQPEAASVERAIINPIAVSVIVLIFEVPWLVLFTCTVEPVSTSAPSIFPYFGFLATGEGDAAGEGLAAGLGLVAGAVTVLPGEDAGDGDDVTFGEFESFPESQPAAKAIARIVGSNIVVRRINFSFGLLIVLPRSSKIEKRDDDCPDANFQQWVFPQVSRRNLRSNCTETLVFERVLARLANAVCVVFRTTGTGGGGSV